jgi:DNA modification methylase
MIVELRPLADIKPYPNNPRINEHAVAAVAASIRAFGFRQPIVVDEDGVILAGHTRYKAALRLGLKQVPVHVARGLTPDQARAYRLADNKTAELAHWDEAMLAQELAALQDLQFDFEELGFASEELARLLNRDVTPGLTDPDHIPTAPDAALTQLGDLWLLDEHRVLCADAAQPQAFAGLLDGAPVHLVHTDPPYNVHVEPRSNNAIAAGLTSFAGKAHHQRCDLERVPGKAQPTERKLRPKDRPLVNDFLPEAEFDHLLRRWFTNLARVLLPGRAFVIWGGYANLGNYPPALKETGLYYSQAIVWDKEHPVLTHKDFMGAFELAFYGWREGAAHQFFGPANATNLWHVKKVSPQHMVHLTEKPVALAARALEYTTRHGEHVLDPFGGSGSTLIAAAQSGRRAFVMELDPLYVDVIVERWQRFTGKQAQRQPQLLPPTT